MALAHTSNTLAMNFLCGTRTFWLFGLPKVTECGQGDFISPGNGEFGPRVVVFCLLSFTAPKGKPEWRPLFGSALRVPVAKDGSWPVCACTVYSYRAGFLVSKL